MELGFDSYQVSSQSDWKLWSESIDGKKIKMNPKTRKQNMANTQLNQDAIAQMDERYSNTAQMDQVLLNCRRLTLNLDYFFLPN